MVTAVNFATLMAPSVHDMKNIIAAVSQAYESLIAQLPDELRNNATGGACMQIWLPLPRLF